VIILSSKTPVTGSVRKESVKVCTPKSPPTTDNAAFDLATLQVFRHSARAEAQDFPCFAQREQTISNRRGCVSPRSLVFFHPVTSFPQTKLGRKMGAKPGLFEHRSREGW
jgi:hypothetical protein